MFEDTSVGDDVWVIIYIATVIVFIWAWRGILHKMGYSGWYVLLFFIPIVNLAAFFYLASVKWPIEKELEGLKKLT